MIFLRTGILYSIIICAFILFSSFFSSFLVSLKQKKNREDRALIVFLGIFGIYWLVYLISNVFGWLDMVPICKSLSYPLIFLLALQPMPLLYYYIRSRIMLMLFLLIGAAFYALTFKEISALTTITFWGVHHGTSDASKFIFILFLLLPLGMIALVNGIKDLRIRSKLLFVESITLLYVFLKVLNLLFDNISWLLLLLRMPYIFIGFIAYFYLTGEEATAKFAQKLSPRLADFLTKFRASRIPFFTKLLILFLLFSVIPIASAGLLLFLTFKEIIDLYIYKPLLWNLKMSKEEFLFALSNVQIEAMFLIMLVIILVLIVSSVASRSIAQSLKRIGLGMKKIEEGDLSHKLVPESNDEIGDLVNYFNKMASEIKRSREIMENWNKELEKTVEERTKNLQTLYNISKAIGLTLNLTELLDKSVEYIPPIAGSKYLSIYIKDERGDFHSMVSRGLDKKHSFKPDEGIFGEAIQSGQVVKIAGINEASMDERKVLAPLDLKTLLLVPMENKGNKVGLIVIGSQKEYTPSDIELNLISTIADQMAIAIENASVFEKEKEAVKKLLELDKMKTELISMVSHELRTPLTSIKGFLAHFINGTTGQTNNTQKKFLMIMNKESDHLLEYIDDLLEFSRIERGALNIRKEKVAMDKLIHGIVEAIRPQIEAKKIKLSLKLYAGNTSFMGDDIKIGEVLRNLIGNSIKFVSKDPKIEVSSNILKGDLIEVRIKDNGIGIDSDHIKKIFHKFYQIDSSLTRKVGGLGLGLTISKEIVEAHGGSINAESDGLGKGSTFIFTLPMIK